MHISEQTVQAMTIAAFVMLMWGVVNQMIRVVVRGKSDDISLWEIFQRLFASGLLFIAFAATRNIYLTIGQIIFLVLYLAYVIIVIQKRTDL